MNYTFTRPATVTDQQILDLYESVDWQAYLQDPANTLAALAHSAVLWATDDQRLIGLIRGITDNHTILYIQDILVNPAYQGYHVGTQLMQQLLTHYQHIGQTVLITDPEEKTGLGQRYPDPICDPNIHSRNVEQKAVNSA